MLPDNNEPAIEGALARAWRAPVVFVAGRKARRPNASWLASRFWRRSRGRSNRRTDLREIWQEGPSRVEGM